MIDWLVEHPKYIYVGLLLICVLSGGMLYLGVQTEKADALHREAMAYDQSEKPYAGVVRVTSAASWQADVVDTDRPVLVDFWTTYCPVCLWEEPVIVGLAKQMNDKARFLKVERDDEKELSSRYGITDIPDLVVFKNGKEVTRFVGGEPSDVLRKALEAAAI